MYELCVKLHKGPFAFHMEKSPLLQNFYTLTVTDVTDKYQLWSHNIYITKHLDGLQNRNNVSMKMFCPAPSYLETPLLAGGPPVLLSFSTNLYQDLWKKLKTSCHFCRQFRCSYLPKSCSSSCRPNYDPVINIYHPGGRKHVGPAICIPRNQRWISS